MVDSVASVCSRSLLLLYIPTDNMRQFPAVGVMLTATVPELAVYPFTLCTGVIAITVAPHEYQGHIAGQSCGLGQYHTDR